MKTLIARHKAGEHIGICSVCSAHPLVIEAALAFDRNSTRKVLIEATSNQVNQFGGYTGMTPADFREFVFAIADRVGLRASALFSAATIWGQTAGSKKMRMRRWKNPSSW